MFGSKPWDRHIPAFSSLVNISSESDVAQWRPEHQAHLPEPSPPPPLYGRRGGKTDDIFGRVPPRGTGPTRLSPTARATTYLEHKHSNPTLVSLDPAAPILQWKKPRKPCLALVLPPQPLVSSHPTSGPSANGPPKHRRKRQSAPPGPCSGSASFFRWGRRRARPTPESATGGPVRLG